MAATKSRVVITGLGAVTPLGNDVGSTWDGLLNGRSGVAPITKFDVTRHSVKFGAELKNFTLDGIADPKDAKRMDPFAQYALRAAAEAVKDSGVDFQKLDRYRCGCILASGIGGLNELQEQHTKFVQKGPERISPFLIPKLMLNAAAGQVAIAYGLGGPNWAIASACASANHAMGTALRLIQYGDADLILTGGTEAALTYLAMAGFGNMGALSSRNDAPEKASRPFDKNRDGFVLGEGAGVLVFEKLEHAQARGARIYAEVLGIGNTDDAYHITSPDPEGTGGARAMQLALQDAGLRPEQVSYINAHGTSTPLNDKIETAAIKKALGEHARKIPINSTKSMTGHLLGAAAGVELVATVLSIRDGFVHPTANYETPDPDCDLDYVPGAKRAVQIQYAFSNSLGFGGHNSTLVVGRYPR